MARRAVVAIACAFTAVALTSCGSREAEVLGTAFKNPPKTSNLTIKVGVQSNEYTFDATAAGPYQSRGEHKMPAFDFKLNVVGVTPDGIEGRVISTGENWFIQYKGETYEAGEELVREAEHEDATGPSRSLSPAEVQQLLNDARDWFPDSETQENATLDGEPVTRVTGNLDVKAAVKDFAKLLEKRGGPKLRESDVNELDRAVSEASFTIDVGKSDGKLRRIDAHLGFDAPDDPGAISFYIRWRDVDKPVTIDAPKSGRPIEELGRKLDQEFGDSESKVS
jgi:hypothetical protein